MITQKYLVQAVLMAFILSGCKNASNESVCNTYKHHIIFDTDANNEVDDQYALAYLLFSGNHFAVEGVTVNATSDPDSYGSFSPVSDHYNEARRIMKLCGVFDKIPLFTGAQGSFDEIKDKIETTILMGMRL